MSEKKRNPISIGADLRRVYEIEAELEQLIEDSMGEVTPEVEAREAEFLAAESSAIERLASYRAYVHAHRSAIEDRIKALDAMVTDWDRRDAWALARLTPLAERRVEGSKRKSFQAGLHVIQVRAGSMRVEVSPDVDLGSLPKDVLREKTFISVDKTAAKAILERGTVALPGLSLQRGPTRVTVK